MPTADEEIRFQAEGGMILGVDNGNPTYVGPLRSDRIPAHAGMCIAVIQSGTKSGRLTVTAASAGLAGASVSVEAR